MEAPANEPRAEWRELARILPRRHETAKQNALSNNISVIRRLPHLPERATATTLSGCSRSVSGPVVAAGAGSISASGNDEAAILRQSSQLPCPQRSPHAGCFDPAGGQSSLLETSRRVLVEAVIGPTCSLVTRSLVRPIPSGFVPHEGRRPATASRRPPRYRRRWFDRGWHRPALGRRRHQPQPELAVDSSSGRSQP